MIPIIRRTILDRWRMLLSLVIVGVLSQWMYIALYPTYASSFAESEEIFKNMPEAFKKVINMESFSMDNLEKYLTMEMYSMFWLILTIIFITSLAGTAIAGDVERETVVQSASQPVPRRSIFLGKFLAAAAMFTLFNLAINVVVLPLANLHNVASNAPHYLVVGLMGELFGLALLAFGFGVSSFLADKGRSHALIGGVLVGMYILNIISGLSDKIDKLKYASLFYYFNPNTFLVKGEYDLTATLVFTGFLAAGLGIGLWRWSKRSLV